MPSTKDQKIRGMTLLIESLHKPDSKLRACAHNQECYDELLNYRDELVEYCHTKLGEINAQS
jgi:hypothetical protein